MGWMMRVAALAALALLSCGFGTYNRETDQKSVAPVKEGFYVFDGFLKVDGKPHRYKVLRNNSGVYVIYRHVPPTKARPFERYEADYGVRLYELPGLPANVYAMQFRNTGDVFEDKPFYWDGFLKISKETFLEVYQYAFVGEDAFTPAANEMIDKSKSPYELKNASRDFMAFMLELWKTHDGMKPMIGRFKGPID